MGDFDALGDAVTGSLLARAVEPRAGEAAPNGHTHEKNCLNCGASLIGPYCAACGQKAHVHRSLRGFMHDFIQGLFNFEGKIWQTLPMLALKPGEMTRRYIAGERARFVSPVGLYLFTVFAMFAALNLTGALGTPKHFQSELKQDIADNQIAIAKLEAKKAAGAAGADLARIDRKLAKLHEDIAENQKLVSGKALVTQDPGDETPSFIKPFIENARENPEVVSMKFQDAASKFSWLLIPLSVPFLWLLFPFQRRYNSYDHAVFVTYSLSFMMMLVITGSLLVAVGFSTLASLLFFVPPFHMYRHLKGSYGLQKWSAIVRTIALVTFAFVAAAMFLAAAVAIGAM
jgi:hypothetical protein